ncbi:MAG TPA: hypothetical protein VJ001_04185 [Rhodocyclaceae bacterium]|nr:hypothetical protein [Rhodocyclaceae bacterium]
MSLAVVAFDGGALLADMPESDTLEWLALAVLIEGSSMQRCDTIADIAAPPPPRGSVAQ